jgi:hypothetical protein
MAATAAMIARVRRMTAEPTTTTYSDAVIAEYIETYPVIDAASVDPTGAGWVPSYDLHAAAADIWEEKAALLQPLFDFSADGGSYDRSQAYEAAKDQARYHFARRRPSSKASVKWPIESDDLGSL